MKVRLIKTGASRAAQAKNEEPPKAEQRPEEVQIVDTIRSWVNDFKSRKANRARLEVQRICNS